MNARFSVMDMFNALYARLFYRSIHVVKSTSILGRFAIFFRHVNIPDCFVVKYLPFVAFASILMLYS